VLARVPQNRCLEYPPALQVPGLNILRPDDQQLPFGNLDTSFVESDLRSLGIASGDAFYVRCRDQTFEIVLGRNFGDVARGEWVAFFPGAGPLKIARNFASAAQASGCQSGDSLFASVRPRVN
jgi:S-adenosylmethionine hydrolase